MCNKFQSLYIPYKSQFIQKPNSVFTYTFWILGQILTKPHTFYIIREIFTYKTFTRLYLLKLAFYLKAYFKLSSFVIYNPIYLGTWENLNIYHLESLNCFQYYGIRVVTHEFHPL